MRFAIRLVVLWMVLVVPHLLASATDCSTNCAKRCYKKRWGVKYDDPVCKAACDWQRELACQAKIELPDVPMVTDPTIIPPSPKDLEEMYYAACAKPFETVTSWTHLKCKNYSGRMANQRVVSEAKQILWVSGLFSYDELNGVRVRWCPLDGAHGMAPTPDEVYIDEKASGDVVNAAAILAHEMQHIRQWRRHGASFACKYSEALVSCGGCQNNGNRFEKEAYGVEALLWSKLNQHAWFCKSMVSGSGAVCDLNMLGSDVYVGQLCTCQGETGRAIR